MNFEVVAPYLKDPLILIGFVLFLFFGFVRALVRSDKIKPVAGKASYRVLQAMLLYGFLLGLAIAALGFGLKYREMSDAEQRSALGLLQGELEANVATVEQLRQNTITLLTVLETVATVLRRPEFPVTATLFPASNVAKGETRSPNELALAAAEALVERGLDRDAKEIARTQELAVAVRRTVEATQPTIRSLGDAENKRYVIRDQAWEAQLPVLRKVAHPGVADYHATYQRLRQIRASYAAVVTSVESYLEAVHSFFNKDEPIDLSKIAAVLALERHAVNMAVRYGDDLVEALEQLRALAAKLEAVAVSEPNPFGDDPEKRVGRILVLGLVVGPWIGLAGAERSK